MRRLWRRVLIELARLGFALAVAVGSAIALESTCPAPTPENSSPGCEGLSLLFGGFVGFVTAIVLTLVAEHLRGRSRHS